MSVTEEQVYKKRWAASTQRQHHCNSLTRLLLLYMRACALTHPAWHTRRLKQWHINEVEEGSSSSMTTHRGVLGTRRARIVARTVRVLRALRARVGCGQDIGCTILDKRCAVLAARIGGRGATRIPTLWDGAGTADARLCVPTTRERACRTWRAHCTLVGGTRLGHELVQRTDGAHRVITSGLVKRKLNTANVLLGSKHASGRRPLRPVWLRRDTLLLGRVPQSTGACVGV